MTLKPITDKAEVSIDFPDKAYIGSFTRHSGFEAHADDEGVAFKLARGGEDKRVVELHLHYYLFADLLEEVAASMQNRPPLDAAHRAALVAAAERLRAAMRKARPPRRKSAGGGA